MQTGHFIRPLSALVVTLTLAGCMVYQPLPDPGHASARPRLGEVVPDAREAELAALLTRAPGQRRTRMTRNALLDSVARARARDMAARGYFGHVTPDGIGANTIVRRAGYALPASYPASLAAHNVESAAAGYPYAAARDVWRGWMGSSGHRAHLLGQHPMFAAQTEFGIGYVYRPDSRKGHYWVVLIAPPQHAASADAS